MCSDGLQLRLDIDSRNKKIIQIMDTGLRGDDCGGLEQNGSQPNL